jgi:hypothetical protein
VAAAATAVAADEDGCGQKMLKFIYLLDCEQLNYTKMLPHTTQSETHECFCSSMGETHFLRA